MPRAREKLHPLWYDSDTLEGRAGSGGTFARKDWQPQWPSPLGTGKGSPSRSLKKLPIVMGIRPACHAVHRLGDVVVGLGVSGLCRTYELG